MSEATRPHEPTTWLPPQLDPTAARAGVDLTQRLRLVAGAVAPSAARASSTAGSPASSDPIEVDRLVDLVRHYVDEGRSIASVLYVGRDLSADEVMRKRATTRAGCAHPDLGWGGPEVAAATQLSRLMKAAWQADAGREVSLGRRLQGIAMEVVLLAYAATELVDPKVMRSTLSLDVLAFPSATMPANVIARLGAARALLDEQPRGAILQLDGSREHWDVVERALERLAVGGDRVADAWAEQVVRNGRAATSRRIDLRA